MGKSQQQDAVNLSSVFFFATKSLCDLSHVISQSIHFPTSKMRMFTPFSHPFDCLFLLRLPGLVAATASCHSSHIQLLTPPGPYISVGTDVVKPRMPVF